MLFTVLLTMVQIKAVPYSLSALRLELMWSPGSHPGARLSLLSARSLVTFPAADDRSTTLYS